jgi:YVTN family beta-propeller protein
VVSPDGKRLYVADEARLAIDVVDTGSLQLAGVIPIPQAATLPGLALSPDGAQLYVVGGPGWLSVVNTAAGRVVTRLELGNGSAGIAVSPDGGRVYVANRYSANLSVVDPSADRVVATIPAGQRPFGVAISPNGRWVYVTNATADGTVTVIEAATQRVHTTVQVQPFPSAVAVNPIYPDAYVAHSVTPSVASTALMDWIKSPDQKQAYQRYPGGNSPSVAVSPDGKRLYLIAPEWRIVAAVSWQSAQAEAVAATGKSPTALALSPDGKRLYVSDQLDQTVAAIDTATFQVIGTVPLATSPGAAP